MIMSICREPSSQDSVSVHMGFWNRLPVPQKNPIEFHCVLSSYYGYFNWQWHGRSFRGFKYFSTPTTHHPGHSWLRDVGISCKPLAAHTPGPLLSSKQNPIIDWKNIEKHIRFKSPVSTCFNLPKNQKQLNKAWDIKKLLTSVLTVDVTWVLMERRAFGTSWSQKMATSEQLLERMTCQPVQLQDPPDVPQV